MSRTIYYPNKRYEVVYTVDEPSGNSKTVRFDEHLGLILAERPKIKPPEVKTEYVEILGANGELDLTGAVDGKIYFGSTEAELRFIVHPNFNAQFVQDYFIQNFLGRAGILDINEWPTDTARIPNDHQGFYGQYGAGWSESEEGRWISIDIDDDGHFTYIVLTWKYSTNITSSGYRPRHLEVNLPYKTTTYGTSNAKDENSSGEQSVHLIKSVSKPPWDGDIYVEEYDTTENIQETSNGVQYSATVSLNWAPRTEGQGGSYITTARMTSVTANDSDMLNKASMYIEGIYIENFVGEGEVEITYETNTVQGGNVLQALFNQYDGDHNPLAPSTLEDCSYYIIHVNVTG